MKRAVGVVLIGLLSSCVTVPTSEEAGISFSMTPPAWPEDRACINEEQPEVAREIVLVRDLTVVVAAGPRAISTEDWARYRPGFPNQKNSLRALRFQRSCFTRSPGAPADCQGGACRRFVEVDGYSWLELAKIRSFDCIGDGCSMTRVRPGGLAVVVIEKCHEMGFEGDVVELRGPDGARAIMHAGPTPSPALDVELPEGWSLVERALQEELVVRPFGDDGACLYAILRDAKQQAYHLIEYSSARYPR